MGSRGGVALLCLTASLAAHGLMLAAAWPPAPAPSSGSVAAPVSVRMFAAGNGAATLPVEAQERLPPLAASRLGELPPTPALEVSPLPATAAVLDGDNDGYIPRPRLTLPPQPREPVLLVWPDEGGASGHYSEVLALFIDETGIVRRVRVEGSGLPPAFEQVARQTFLGTRFLPGELQGRQVKSRIRVEVSFDAAEMDRGKGVR